VQEKSKSPLDNLKSICKNIKEKTKRREEKKWKK